MNSRVRHGHQYIIALTVLFFVLFSACIVVWYLAWGRSMPISRPASDVVIPPPSFGIMEDARLTPIPAEAAPENLFPEIPGVTRVITPLGLSWWPIFAHYAHAAEAQVSRPSTQILSEYIFSIVGNEKPRSSITIGQSIPQETDAIERDKPTGAIRMASNSPQQALKTSATQKKEYYAGYPENWVGGGLDYTLTYSVQVPVDGYYTLTVPYTGCEPAPNGGCVEQSSPQFNIPVNAEVQVGTTFVLRGTESAILQHPSVGRLNFDMGRLTKGQNTLRLKFTIPSRIPKGVETKSFGLQLQPLTLSSSSTLNDAIGIRVLNNTTAVPVELWYVDQGIEGQPEVVVDGVDGFPAIQDGRTTYITALNKGAGGVMYINTYVVTYSEGASQETINIYNQLLRNMRLAVNIDSRFALEARRDTQRYFDMKRLSRALDQYRTLNGAYPLLESGTFVKGLVVSTWPSWQQTLGAALGGTLPVDPLNKLVGCETFQCSNNQRVQCAKDGDCGVVGTCQQWGATTCYDPVLRQFKATEGSHAYAYRFINRESYQIGVEYEYFGAGQYPQSRDGNPSNDLNFFADTRHRDTSGRQSVFSVSVGVCGDAIVQDGEMCEIGQIKELNDPIQGKISVPCTDTCRWAAVGVVQQAGICGDGIKQSGETCDDGNRNGQYGFCNNQCKGLGERCGDNTRQANEVCDGEVGVESGQVCAPDCQGFVSTCGNQVVEAGEVCDGEVEYVSPANTERWSSLETPLPPRNKHGQLKTQKRACKSDCSGFNSFAQVAASATTEGARCGDGVVDAQKVCHVNFTYEGLRTLSATGKTCLSNSDCVRVNTVAGEIVVNGECRPVEQCDDGNTTENDSCTNTCTLPVCGDGVVQGKQCIARSNNRPDGRVCASDKECGSGFLCGTVEECDVGVNNGVVCNSEYGRECSYCSNSCKIVVQTGRYCGDGNVDVDAGEVCDGAKYLKNGDNPPRGVWPSARANGYFGLLAKTLDLEYRDQKNATIEYLPEGKEEMVVSLGRYSICADDCKSACPPATVTSNILFNPRNPVRSVEFRSWAGGEIKTGSISMPIPACRWSPVDTKLNNVNSMQLADNSALKKGFRMSINFDASKIISYNNPRVLFVFDTSGSMLNCIDSGSAGATWDIASCPNKISENTRSVVALTAIKDAMKTLYGGGISDISTIQTTGNSIKPEAQSGPEAFTEYSPAIGGGANCTATVNAIKSWASGDTGPSNPSNIVIFLSDGFPYSGQDTAQGCMDSIKQIDNSVNIFSIPFVNCSLAGDACNFMKALASEIPNTLDDHNPTADTFYYRQGIKSGQGSVLGLVYNSITTAVRGMSLEYKLGDTVLGRESLVSPSDNHTLPDFDTNLCRGKNWDMTIFPKFVPRNPNDLPTITIRDASIDYCPVPQP